MRFAILILLTFLLNYPISIFSQQEKPFGYCGYHDNEPYDVKGAKEKSKDLKEMRAILKGGIWDEVMPNIVYVPMAKFIKDYYIGSAINPVTDRSTTCTIIGSFMLNTEVTNKMYRYFLADSTNAKFQPRYGVDTSIVHVDLKKYFSIKDKGKTYTTVTYQLLDDYPVVGITWYAADAFCKWLTKKADSILKNTAFKQIPNFHLPSQIDFDRANIMNLMDDHYTFNELRKKYVAQFFSGEIANVNYGETLDSISDRSREATDDGFYFTNPVKKFRKGNVGLYGMQGNAAEWSSDIYSLNDALMSLSTYETLANNPLSFRTVLGGSWYDSPFYLQPSVKQKLVQGQSSERVGFRFAIDFFQ